MVTCNKRQQLLQKHSCRQLVSSQRHEEQRAAAAAAAAGGSSDARQRGEAGEEPKQVGAEAHQHRLRRRRSPHAPHLSRRSAFRGWRSPW